MEKTMLETISLDHQNTLKHFEELLKTKVITFEQYSELVDKSQKHCNELFREIQKTLLEDMKLFYQSKEKIISGLEPSFMSNNESFQKCKFSE